MAIKVLIVDDSAVVRQVYKKLLESEADIQVIGTAADPYIAVQKIQREKPDVITLDIEMPRMDGLTFLGKIMKQAPMPVVVISNQTSAGADVAMKALEMGAKEVLGKPKLISELQVSEYRIDLVDKIRSAYQSKRLYVASGSGTVDSSKCTSSIHTSSQPFPPNFVIAVGASTGGIEAIAHFLSGLPSNMPPILIVQHMPADFTASFARRLNQSCALTVKEAQDKELLRPGTVYIAPGGKHMAIRNYNGNFGIAVFDGELVNRHRPSVNVLFNSVAELKGKNALGVILTGMGDDGASGLLAMHQRGAFTIAQDEASSVIYGMPHKALIAGGVSEIMPLDQIALVVCEKLSRGGRAS
jgi:two-component system, chemotaxis family, protein-glutamate methylesterase/glutaminase